MCASDVRRADELQRESRAAQVIAVRGYNKVVSWGEGALMARICVELGIHAMKQLLALMPFRCHYMVNSV